jgi:hypothetical protein
MDAELLKHDLAHTVAQFARDYICQHADEWHRTGAVPRKVLADICAIGLAKAAFNPDEAGASGWHVLGACFEELGAACSSVRCCITVQSIVGYALGRWWRLPQAQSWLERMANGDKVCAFALSEPNTGSDTAGIETLIEREKHGVRLNGVKRWITNGAIADAFLVVAKHDSDRDGKCLLFVERSLDGVSISETLNMAGARGSHTAEIQFTDALISRDRIIGANGFGGEVVVSDILDYGRFTVAWGCVGLQRACLKLALERAAYRHQFGRPLRDHDLVRRILSRMYSDYLSSRALCIRATESRAARAPDAVGLTAAAKFHAASCAVNAANECVHLMGAAGSVLTHPAQRWLADAKVMALIEGSREIHELSLVDYAFQDQNLKWVV